MDHSWRPPPMPPPPIPGNNDICPICSTSHFPFCHIPPPFIENPRFHYTQSQTDYYHKRPRFDPPPPPFPNHQISLNYNYDHYNPSDGYSGRGPTWYGSNPSFDMNQHDRVVDDNIFNRGGVSASYFGHDGYDNGSIKRMKIESIDNNRGPRGSFTGGEIADSLRFSSDNERILKLIHDHGNAANAAPGGLPKGGADLLTESSGSISTRYGHERFGETHEVLKRRQDTSDLPNTGSRSFEMNESSLFHGSNREGFGVVHGRHSVYYDQTDESQYDQIESSRPLSLDYGSHGSERGLPYHSVLQRSEPIQKLHKLQDVHDRRTETLHEYHNLQRTTLSNVALIKESSFSQPGQSQLPLPADVMLHQQANHNSQPSYDWPEPKSHYAPNSHGASFGPVEVPHLYRSQPPLPTSPPPPPPPMDPPRNHFFEPPASSPAKKPSLFPIAVSSSADSLSSQPAIPENQSSAKVYYTNNTGHHASTISSVEEFHTLQPSSKTQVRDVQPFPLHHLSSEKPNVIDASHIFRRPHRASRPDHLVVILRGLPGSGKSYLAKVLRDIEVENGGEAPRIHSMDEYFMTEVEKVEDTELSKNSGSLRGKRQVMKKVMEYCYEPEMEEAYRASMLKAFKKTLDEGVYSFIIVDDRNLRVADFAQFWATAKRSGYEVYIVEAAYKDPAGCAARNVHNFTLDDIRKMSQHWEEAPSLYLKMDIKSLLHGDSFDKTGIQEVDMDMEDDDAVDATQRSDVKSPQDVTDPVVTPHDVGPLNDVKHPVEDHVKEKVNNHLSRSKWSNDLDGSDSLEAEGGKKNASAFSGLIQAYSKDGKSVHWGDQGGNVGFSISATRKMTRRSLVIGPGSGYNLKSNPLSEEEYLKPVHVAMEPKSQSVFQERIRAERESFKAVFDKRRQRIGGFNIDDE